MATACAPISFTFSRGRLSVPCPSQCSLPRLIRHRQRLQIFSSLNSTVDHRLLCRQPLVSSCCDSSSCRSPDTEDYLTDNLNRTLSPSPTPAKTFFWIVLWASVSLFAFAFAGSRNANASVAADTSIKASAFGRKIAIELRRFGWLEEAIVFALATLPVIELRGAIPVGYWMQMNPVKLTTIAVIGNMVPVPLIVLFAKKLAAFLAVKNLVMSRLLNWIFKKAKEKASPVEEFQWLGLMLFVAVPFPGTGAWTGAIIASVLEMPFWSAVSANFVGVVVAGVLVNVLVTIGLKYAIATGVLLFLLSTFMWKILRSFRARNSMEN